MSFLNKFKNKCFRVGGGNYSGTNNISGALLRKVLKC